MRVDQGRDSMLFNCYRKLAILTLSHLMLNSLVQFQLLIWEYQIRNPIRTVIWVTTVFYWAFALRVSSETVEKAKNDDSANL